MKSSSPIFCALEVMNRRAFRGKSNVSRSMRRSKVMAMLPMVLLVFTTQATHAGSATWSTSPISSDWNDVANWDPMTVPNDPADTATFGSSENTEVVLSDFTEVNGIAFSPNGSAFTITANPFSFLLISGAGIVNNSGTLQNFVVDVDASSHAATVYFTNTASAGTLTAFTTNGAVVAGGAPGALTEFFASSNAGSATFIDKASTVGTGGGTNFHQNSTAGNAVFTNTGGTLGAGGTLHFLDTASAGNGTFTNEGGSTNGPSAGITQFLNNSSASSATLIANGGTANGASGGMTQFSNSSTASNAVLIANAGMNGGQSGSVSFADDSSAGNASLIINGAPISFSNNSIGGTARLKMSGGFLDISSHNSPGITLGSLEGSGTIFLNSRNLTVGSNSLTTTFSGSISDCVTCNGNSITKTGNGTLRLSGTNNVSGGTNINSGRVLVNGANFGPIVVGGGAVLGGTGFITGNVSPATVNVGAGGAVLGGDATTASGSLGLFGQLSFQAGSIIELTVGPFGAHSSLARFGGTWTFAPNQAFTLLDLGAAPGMYDNIITGLSGDPGSEASWTVTNAGFLGTFIYDGAGNIDLNLAATSGPALKLTDAVSRKMHGSLGPFDVPLLIPGLPGVECRSGGPARTYTLVFTFTNDVVSGNASITAGTGTVSGSPTFAGNTMTVNVTDVADVQKITVTLDSVTDSLSQILPDSAVSVIMLVGDVTKNKTVNGTDVSQTKAQSGIPVTSSNFRMDVTANGVITGTDVSLVKLRSGFGVP